MTCECGEVFEGHESVGAGQQLCQMCWEDYCAREYWGASNDTLLRECKRLVAARDLEKRRRKQVGWIAAALWAGWVLYGLRLWMR